VLSFETPDGFYAELVDSGENPTKVRFVTMLSRIAFSAASGNLIGWWRRAESQRQEERGRMSAYNNNDDNVGHFLHI